MRRLIVFSVVIISIGIATCNIAGDSSVEIIKEKSNGNGTKAVLFMKFGGATVNNSLQIALIGGENKIKNGDSGNIFICDDTTGGVNKSDANISWKSPDTLEIIYKRGLRLFKKEQDLKNIRIIYKSVE
jgi:hypothetical protein